MSKMTAPMRRLSGVAANVAKDPEVVGTWCTDDMLFRPQPWIKKDRGDIRQEVGGDINYSRE
jgi:hypothetical protein